MMRITMNEVTTIKQTLLHFCQKLEVLDSTSSTNQTIKSYPVTPSKPAVCIAKTQSRGRGRSQKEWTSDLEGNLYFSFKYISKAKLGQLSQLSLYVGLWLVELLEQAFTYQQLKIKWPNDVYCFDKKLAGILIETMTEDDELIVIIGIGLNLVADKRPHGNPRISLEEIDKEKVPCLWHLSSLLINSLYDKLITNKLESNLLLPKWRKYDFLAGRNCCMLHNNEHYFGIARGISSSGGLILELEDGNKQTFFSGELHFE